jgi:hypothetical protein
MQATRRKAVRAGCLPGKDRVDHPILNSTISGQASASPAVGDGLTVPGLNFAKAISVSACPAMAVPSI